jgi:hypothetical protein
MTKGFALVGNKLIPNLLVLSMAPRWLQNGYKNILVPTSLVINIKGFFDLRSWHLWILT